jgi:sec-independent protein translocase protein TatB
MVSQFSSELDRQLKAEELREELRKAGDVGLDDVQKSVRGALDEAKKYEHLVLSDDEKSKPRPAPATRRVTEPAEPGIEPEQGPTSANGSGHAPTDKDTQQQQGSTPDHRS